MAATEAVDASLAKKRRTEEAEDKKPSMLAYDSEEEDDVPLSEEAKRQISDFEDRLRMSGGFDVPKIPPGLSNYAFAQIHRRDPVDCQTDENLINVVNTAIRHHKKNKEKLNNNNEMLDLVLVEILSAAWESSGTWPDYITFKAKDSSGAVRTYETLIDPKFSDEQVLLEIFRVKPYTAVEYPEHNTVERPGASV